jgi:hypothetical protein
MNKLYEFKFEYHSAHSGILNFNANFLPVIQLPEYLDVNEINKNLRSKDRTVVNMTLDLLNNISNIDPFHLERLKINDADLIIQLK